MWKVWKISLVFHRLIHINFTRDSNYQHSYPHFPHAYTHFLVYRHVDFFPTASLHKFRLHFTILLYEYAVFRQRWLQITGQSTFYPHFPHFPPFYAHYKFPPYPLFPVDIRGKWLFSIRKLYAIMKAVKKPHILIIERTISIYESDYPSQCRGLQCYHDFRYLCGSLYAACQR